MNIHQLVIISALLCVSSIAYADADNDTKPMPDGDVKALIINGNISSYQGDCPCPYSQDRDRRNTCGENSVYNQNPGEIKCYPGDISDQELKQFRIENNIEVPKLPWDKKKKEGY